MSQRSPAPFGSWRSPITAELISQKTAYIDQVQLDAKDVYWTEVRPAEGGRFVLMRKREYDEPEEPLPAEYSVRTAVHEYGGGAFTVFQGMIFFSNFTDGRVYIKEADEPPRPITPEGNYRYADFIYDGQRKRLICIREDHTKDERNPENTIISISVNTAEVKTLQSGNDFYSSPKLSHDLRNLAWVTWNHPNMPWDGTELYTAPLNSEGELGPPKRIAGGISESIFQPEWSPEDTLFFVSDRTGWWNIYRSNMEQVEQMTSLEAEFGLPQWNFGLSTYAFESERRVICTYTKKGSWYLALLDVADSRLEQIALPYNFFRFVRAGQNFAVFLAASTTELPHIVRYSVTGRSHEVLYRPKAPVVDLGYLSLPQFIQFPSTKGRVAYANFYEPKNREYRGRSKERPPLIVICHGGPTSMSPAILSLDIQYWTSRGFAVADVNYGGSTGFGRLYRESLYGEWGVIDVEDCCRCAEYLAKMGKVDSNRLIIRGGSAGGYTTLSALAFRNTFKAGASYFGVSDLERLLLETHKFESRYLEKLIGPYPAEKKKYDERSPLRNAKKISSPIALFQGSEDRVVPPNQSELIYKAVKEKRIPVLYMLFPGERHGFVKAENIKRAREAELYFYSRIFGFTPADQLDPVSIDNIERWK